MEETMFNFPAMPTDEELQESNKRWIRRLKENITNFSYWSERMKPVDEKAFKQARSVTFNLPDELYPCLFCEKKDDREKLRKWVSETVFPIVQSMKFGERCFLKNGCFSNKFDFNNSCKLEPITIDNIVSHMLNIEGFALCYETMGDMEWVFREYIEPDDNAQCIYYGMPIRSEMRCFYDFDTHTYLYDVFYWDKDYCFDHFDKKEQAIFNNVYDEIYGGYLSMREEVRSLIEKEMPKCDEMTGMWSIDILIQGNDYWLIDMAPANRSAYYDHERIQKILNHES